MKSVILLLIGLSLTAQADTLSLFGGKVFNAKRSGIKGSDSFTLGAEYNKPMFEMVSASAIAEYTAYKPANHRADHLYSLMIAPTISKDILFFTARAALGLGLQMNVTDEWSYMVGTNRISFIDDKVDFAFVYSPRVSVDFKLGGYLLGVEGAYTKSAYTMDGTSTDTGTGIATPISNEVSQSWFSIMIRFGWEL